MSCWHPRCDQQNYFSIHGPLWKYRGEGIFVCLCSFCAHQRAVSPPWADGYCFRGLGCDWFAQTLDELVLLRSSDLRCRVTPLNEGRWHDRMDERQDFNIGCDDKQNADIWSINTHFQVRIEASKSTPTQALFLLTAWPHPGCVSFVLSSEKTTTLQVSFKSKRQHLSLSGLENFPTIPTSKPCATVATTWARRTWHWLITSAERSIWAEHLLTFLTLSWKSFHSGGLGQ